MVYCSSDKVDVIVKSPELQENDVVQILRHYPGTDTGSGRKYFHCPG